MILGCRKSVLVQFAQGQDFLYFRYYLGNFLAGQQLVEYYPKF